MDALVLVGYRRRRENQTGILKQERIGRPDQLIPNFFSLFELPNE
jgi:hypothetical protein